MSHSTCWYFGILEFVILLPSRVICIVIVFDVFTASSGLRLRCVCRYVPQMLLHFTHGGPDDQNNCCRLKSCDERGPEATTRNTHFVFIVRLLAIRRSWCVRRGTWQTAVNAGGRAWVIHMSVFCCLGGGQEHNKGADKDSREQSRAALEGFYGKLTPRWAQSLPEAASLSTPNAKWEPSIGPPCAPRQKRAPAP